MDGCEYIVEQMDDHLIDELDLAARHGVPGEHAHHQGLQAARALPPCHLRLIPPKIGK